MYDKKITISEIALIEALTKYVDSNNIVDFLKHINFEDNNYTMDVAVLLHIFEGNCNGLIDFYYESLESKDFLMDFLFYAEAVKELDFFNPIVISKITDTISKQAKDLDVSTIEQILLSNLVDWKNYNPIGKNIADFRNGECVTEDSLLKDDVVRMLWDIYATENNWYENIDVDLYVKDYDALKELLEDESYNDYKTIDDLLKYGVSIDYLKENYSEEVENNLQFSLNDVCNILLDEIYKHL